MPRKLTVLAAAAILATAALSAGCHGKTDEGKAGGAAPRHSRDEAKPAVVINDSHLQKAVFSGGRFWCLAPPFAKLPGVKQVVAGYAGCQQENPSYEKVEKGKTECRLAVEVVFDPRRIGYQDLLRTYWRQIDPTDSQGQFGDRGNQYRAAVYYSNYHQKMQAESSKTDLVASGRFDKSIVTMILPSISFYPAEIYNQDYDQKHPQEYKQTCLDSERGSFLEKAWSSAAGGDEGGSAPAAEPQQGRTADE